MELEKAGEPVLRSPTAHTVSKQQGSLFLWVHVVDILIGQLGFLGRWVLLYSLYLLC